jgi:hypothetical protein
VPVTTHMSSQSCRRLFEIASPQLYRLNPFRVLGLPVHVTPREISRHQKRLNMMGKVGIAAGKEERGFLPLDPPPEPEALREAMHRLSDPESRLLDELFWFWPSDAGSREDEVLALLKRNRVDDALERWSRSEKSQGDSVSRHNLAVLYHAQALDLEYRGAQTALSPKELEVCDACWRRAYRRWRSLEDDPRFWKRLESRAADLDDPRLNSETVQRIRGSLPRALLEINSGMAMAAATAGRRDQAHRYVKIMRASELGTDLVERTLREALAPTRDRLKALIKPVQEALQREPERGLELAEHLLRDAKPLLNVFSAVLPARTPALEVAFDDVSEAAFTCGVAYGNKTQNWSICEAHLNRVLPLVRGEAVRARLERNLETLRGNRKASQCFFCEENGFDESASVEISIYGEVTRERTPGGVRLGWKNGKVKVPRCAECRKLHGRQNLVGSLGFLVGAGLGSILFLASPGAGVAGAAIFGLCALLTAVFVHKHVIADGVKPESESKQFPLLRDLLSQGWQIGDKPPEATQQTVSPTWRHP